MSIFRDADTFQDKLFVLSQALRDVAEILGHWKSKQMKSKILDCVNNHIWMMYEYPTVIVIGTTATRQNSIHTLCRTLEEVKVGQEEIFVISEYFRAVLQDA
jgi:hypothetical protein